MRKLNIGEHIDYELEEENEVIWEEEEKKERTIKDIEIVEELENE